MRNSKKFFVLLLGMLIACVFALVACQPTVEPVQLVDFDDVTVTAELGKNYTLPAGTAFDTKDNVYRATYTVKTKSGGNVNVASNQFFVADMGGYVITGVTDTLPDGTTKTRTITVNVVDKGAPEIKMDTAGFGYVNSEYVIPEITVTDLSGETITPVVNVYKVVGETETEVTVANGKFTPTEKATYRIKVSATDSSNNTANQTVDVIVRGERAPYVFEDFSDDYSLSIMTCPENGHSNKEDVWLEEYEGKTGVAYNPETLSMYGPHFYFRLPTELKTVDFEYVYARIYVKSAIGELKPTFDACSWNHVIGTYPVNQWVEVRITIDDILSNTANFTASLETFRNVMTSTNGAYLFWMPAFKEFVGTDGQTYKDTPSNYTVYFDEIGYKPTFVPVLTNETEYELGSTVTLNATVNTSLDASTYSFAYTVTDPSGNAVTLDGNNAFRMIEAGEYTVKVDFVHSEYVGTATYTITAVGESEIIVGEYTGSPKMGDTVTIPTATIDGATVTATVEFNGSTVPMEGNTFVASVAGTYNVIYAAEINGLIYKSVFDIEVDYELGKNEILGFNRAEDLDNFKFKTTNYNIDWLATYEEEVGVIKVTYSGDAWPWLTFTPAQKMSAYQDATYLVVRAKVVSGNNALLYMALGNDAQLKRYPIGYNETVAYDEWVDYTFDITPFLTFWTDGTLNESKARLWFKSASGNNGVLYISDISVVYNASASGITLDVSGEQREGEEITVTMNVPNGITGAQMVVKDPNGEVVTLTDNKFTAVQGTYTIEITCDGYPGVWEQTLIIDAALEINASSKILVNENEVTIPNITVTDLSTNSDVTADATIEVKATFRGEEVTITNNKFTANRIGLYQIVWTATYNGKSAVMEETVLIEFGYEVAPNEVLSFTLDSDIEKVVVNATNPTMKQVTWMDEYKGEEGVAKFEWAGDNWPYMSFGTNQAMSAYADYDYLAVTMYAPSTGNALLYLKLGANTGKDTWPIGYANTIVYDKWQTYLFEIDVFNEYWKSDLADFDWKNKYKLWFKSNGTGSGEFYISDISVIKTFDKSGITVSTTGELYEDETISVSYSNPNEIKNVIMTVTDPAGNVVADPSEFVAMAGTYTVKITASEYYGVETFSVATKVVYGNDVVLNFDKANQIENVVVGGSKAGTTSIAWVASFEGATGVAKVSHTDVWPWLSFTPIHDLATYGEYDRLVFRMFVPDNANALIYMKLFNDGSIAQLPLEIGQSVSKGQWYEYEFDADYFLNHWDPSNAQLYRLWFKAGAEACEFYIDSIMMKKSVQEGGEEGGETGGETGGEEDEIGNDVVLNFDVQDQIANVVVGGSKDGTTSIEWVDSFEGATGVAKISHTDAWPWLTFTPVHELATYGEYDKIVFRMFIPNNDNALIYMKLGNGTGNDHFPTIGQTVVKGEWVEYEILADYFKSSWDPTNNSKNRLWFKAGAGACEFYIDSITMKKNEVVNFDSNVVVNFDSDKQFENILYYEGTVLKMEHVEWVESFDGANGVAKFTVNHEWPWMAIAPLHNMSKYARYDRLVIRAYVEDSANSIRYMKLGNGTGSDQFPIGDGNTVVKGEWHDYVIDATYFVNNWTNDINDNGKNRLWFQAVPTANGSSVFYIDSITMKSSTDFETTTLNTYATLDATTAAGYTGFEHTGTYIDAAAVAADSTLPAIPAGENGYAKVTAKTNAWGVIEFRADVTATYEQFAAADYIEFKYFTPGEDARKIYVYNYLAATAFAGEWNTVRIPMTAFNAGKSWMYQGLKEWYDALVAETITLVNFWDLGKEVDATIYLTEIKLVAGPRNTELGDKYVALDASNFKVNDGTATNATFDDKSVVKLTGGTWANISIIPGKTIGQLQAYDKIVITMYVEGEVAMQLYSQDNIYSTANRVVSYGTSSIEAGADGWTNFPTGQWITVEIPVAHATQLIGQWSASANATMIVRGKAFTAIYVSDVSCVKNA